MVYTADDLAIANLRVADDERHMALQRQIISHLRSAGRPTEVAEGLLLSFGALLEKHRTHRDRVAIRLGEGPPPA